MSSSRLSLALLVAAISPVLAPVGVANAAFKYWDLNDVALGAGPTPSGTWDTLATNTVWNTQSDGQGTLAPWVAGDDAFFSAGSDAVGPYSVTIAGTQTAASVSVEDGTVAFMTGTASVAGATTIFSGAQLNLPSSAQLAGAGKVFLDGGTLRGTNTTNALTFTAKNIEVTANGGRIAYDDGVANAFVALYSGLITGTGGTSSNGGVGTLTKVGADEIRVQGANVANYTFAKLVVLEGLYRIGSTSTPTDGTAERGFGAVPTAFLADAITLNGGSIGTSLAAAAGTLSANRGVTIGANGGTFFGNNGSLTVTGAITGSGKITVTGTNGIAFNGASNVTTFTGPLQADGLLTLNQSLNATNLTGTVATANVAVASTRVLTVGSDGTSTSYGGFVTGAGAFTKVGGGTLTINTNWSNSGPTLISAGTVRFGINAAGLSTTSTITVNGTLDMNAIGDTFGPLAGTGSVIGAGNVTTGNANSASFSGSYSGTGNLTKAGAGNQTFTGTVAHTGATTVNAGVLTLANATSPVLTTTTGVTVTAGSLVLGASQQVRDAATFSLNGGTLNTGGFDEVLGVLTLAVNSVIDLGSADSVLSFADSSGAIWAGTLLRVFNYTGNTDVGGGLDQLFVGSTAGGLTSAQLGKIQFFSDAGTTQIIGTTSQLSTGEVIVAVPEPTSLTLLGLGAAAMLRRRRA